MNTILKYFIVLLFFTYKCSDYEATRSNPLDPANSDYIYPFITILSGPEENETIHSSEVVFTYNGNQTNMLFRTKFNDDIWSDWENSTTASFAYLDEGSHTFQLQGKFSTGDTSDVVRVNFDIDAVTGPALLFNPRRHFTTQGNVVTFYVMAEEVYDLTGMEMVIRYNPEYIGIEAVRQGSIFNGFADAIFFSDNQSSLGRLSITCGIWGGEETSFTGTGSIVEIDVQLKVQDDATIEFDGSELFRDYNNEPIIILEAIDALVQSL